MKLDQNQNWTQYVNQFKLMLVHLTSHQPSLSVVKFEEQVVVFESADEILFSSVAQRSFVCFRLNAVQRFEKRNFLQLKTIKDI